MIYGESWIDDKFVPVVFVKAKDCEFNKENLAKVLKDNNEGVVLDSEVHETYMKFNVGYHHDYGQGFWERSEKGIRGASLFYFAKIKYADYIECRAVERMEG